MEGTDVNRTILHPFSLGHRTAKTLFFISLSLCFLASGTETFAANQNVTNTAASGAGSLPRAVADVGEGENVIFQPSVAGQTITLSSDLDVTKSMNFLNDSGGNVGIYLGENGITVQDESTIGFSSGLTLQKTVNAELYGNVIYSSGNFTLEGFNGVVTSTGTESCDAIYASGNINITNGFSGTLTINNLFVRGIGAGNDINITDGFSGVLTATGDEIVTGLYAYHDINIAGDFSGSISILDGTISEGVAARNNLNIMGSLSSTIWANGTSANGLSAFYNMNIAGNLSSNITVIGEMDSCGIVVYDGDLDIAGHLSGNISVNTSNGNAYGIRANGDINGTSTGTPLIITGSVAAESLGNSMFEAIAIRGDKINLKLDATGTLSAISNGGGTFAIRSTGTASDNIELVAGCTVIGDIDLGSGVNDILTLSGTTGGTTYDGDIMGVETFNVTGGTWHLNGQISGDITVTGGTLGGMAQIVNLVNSGTLAPGNSIGTLTVGGNYTQNAGSTLEIEVDDGGASDLVDVSGTAKINGGTIDVQAESGTYTLGTTYTILDADGGVTGTFDGLIDNLADFNFRLVYGANMVQLVLTEGTYTTLAQTSNQWNMARYLDDHAGMATGDFRSVISRINVLSANDARIAFDSMDGEVYGSLSTVGIENTDRFLRTIATRLRSRGLVNGFDSVAPRMLSDWDDSRGVVRAQDTCGATCQRTDGWLPWGEGYGVGAKIGGDGNASGLDYTVGGFAYGFEQNLDRNTLLGFVGGYSKTFVNLDDRLDHSAIESAQAGLYMHHDSGAGYAAGIVAYGYNAYDSRRQILIGNLTRTARSNHEGNEFSFYFETGRNYGCPRTYYFQPYVALQYIQLHQNGFGESGADSLNLSVGGVHADSFRGLLGTRLTRCFRTNTGRLGTIEGRALWRHEFLDEARILDAQFAGQPGGAFAIQGVNVDRDAAILGGGLSLRLTDHAKIYANYDLLISENYAAHASTGGLMLAW